MDGNGRWAQGRGLPRIEGHRRGVKSVRVIVEECARLGIGQLTLYCLSSENWKRPKKELNFLMSLLEQYVIEERSEIIRQDLTFSMIGRREGLSAGVLTEVQKTIDCSHENRGPPRLCLPRSTLRRIERLTPAMLGWRLSLGTLIISLLAGLLVWDAHLGPLAPCLWVLCLLLGLRSAWEFVRLLDTRSFEVR